MNDNGLAAVTGIYVRVSTEEQAKEGYSIRAQEEKLRSYAALKGWPVYSIYADEGISGKDIEGRPAVKQLIADVTIGKINNVLVYKIDRLTRSTKNLIELVEIFNQHHCGFNSFVENIDTTSATGRMFLKIVGIFAEFERENLAERVRLGLERKVKEGYSICGYIQSYGYNRENGNRVQYVEPEEAEIVRRIFEMYVRDDYNFTQIVNVLNAENIITKRRKKWGITTIERMLANPTYIGKVRYSLKDSSRYFETDGHHEPIIDEDTYYLAQDKLKKSKRISLTKRPSSDVYFCGVLCCSKCGAKYTTHWDYNKRGVFANVPKEQRPAYASYRCVGYMKGDCRTGKSISHVRLEQAFEQYIEQIADFDVNCDVAVPTAATRDNSGEIAAINAEIATIERKTDEIMSLFMSSELDFESYQRMTKMGNERRGELAERLKVLQDVQAARDNGQTRGQIVANFRENWSVLNNEQRQAFVQRFIKKIVAHSEIPKVAGRYEVIIDEVIFNEF